jgi:hypothetical protein
LNTTKGRQTSKKSRLQLRKSGMSLCNDMDLAHQFQRNIFQKVQIFITMSEAPV